MWYGAGIHINSMVVMDIFLNERILFVDIYIAINYKIIDEYNIIIITF